MESGMKILLRAICMRHSGSTAGSESIEKVADSVVNTFVRGRGRARGAPWAAARGPMVIGGSSPAWTLLIRSDQSWGSNLLERAQAEKMPQEGHWDEQGTRHQ